MKNGEARIRLTSAEKHAWSASVDVIVVTDDPEYKPVQQSNGKWDAFYLSEE